METKKERILRLQRERRARNGNKEIHKYEKTKNGFLVRMYRNMKSRVEGVQWKKFHLYYGKELINKETFYKWANESYDFHNLFNIWESSCYNRKLTPTVDRIDSSKGYSLDNMRWITHSENSRLGNESRLLKRRQSIDYN
jgi:hypothetical protein